MEPRKWEGHQSLLGEDLRLNPQLRLCARFDDVSIAEFPVAAPGEMGFRVVDNCAETFNGEARGPDDPRPGHGPFLITLR